MLREKRSLENGRLTTNTRVAFFCSRSDRRKVFSKGAMNCAGTLWNAVQYRFRMSDFAGRFRILRKRAKLEKPIVRFFARHILKRFELQAEVLALDVEPLINVLLKKMG